MPLRLFPGATFLCAGLGKLTAPAFFSATGAGSLGELMSSVRDGSAIPPLADLVLRNPPLFGRAIAAGEPAVGLGALVGLVTRLAAFGGALISSSLWLPVSRQTAPYYYGKALDY